MSLVAHDSSSPPPRTTDFNVQSYFPERPDGDGMLFALPVAGRAQSVTASWRLEGVGDSRDPRVSAPSCSGNSPREGGRAAALVARSVGAGRLSTFAPVGAAPHGTARSRRGVDAGACRRDRRVLVAHRTALPVRLPGRRAEGPRPPPLPLQHGPAHGGRRPSHRHPPHRARARSRLLRPVLLHGNARAESRRRPAQRAPGEAPFPAALLLRARLLGRSAGAV